MQIEQENIFGIVGRAMKQLRRAKMGDKASELAQKVQECKSYKEACDLVDFYLAQIPYDEEKADREWDRLWASMDNDKGE